MDDRSAQIREALAAGPVASESLRARLRVSRATLTRAIAQMAGDIVRIGAARATRYALRDRFRPLPELAVYRVSATGQIATLGTLYPVRPDGFVMVQTDGVSTHHEGLPWWLIDMRPQGFLGRAYAQRHAHSLGLPADVRHWSDTDALRALLASGADPVGHLLLGEVARDHFVNAPEPPVCAPEDYPRLAAQVLGAGQTWSSAGGEQPKFCARSAAGHVLVKFSAAEASPVSTRWRDLLLAEHLALETLQAAGVAAARSRLQDVGTQRFLELERFDRVGLHGRRALVSLAALEGEFVGQAAAPWPVLTAQLAQRGAITPEAHAEAALLFAFGTLIGNTDMHAGNLSFVSDSGPPYALSPAYDMLPMAFSPTSGGVPRDSLAAAHLHSAVDGATWRSALALARAYLARLRQETQWSAAFMPCMEALDELQQAAAKNMARLG